MYRYYSMVMTRSMIALDIKNNDYSRIIGDGLSLSLVLQGSSDIPLKQLKNHHIIYAVGNNTPHDHNVVKVGKAECGFSRLKQYITSWGATTIPESTSGAVLLYLSIIKRGVLVQFLNPIQKSSFIESNLLRGLKQEPQIHQIKERGTEMFQSVSRKFIVSKIQEIMADKKTYTHGRKGSEVTNHTKRTQPGRKSKSKSKCDAELKHLRETCGEQFNESCDEFLKLISN